MNKTIRNLAIAALFIFPGLSGFPQEVQQAAQLQAQAAQLQAQYELQLVPYCARPRKMV